ncbi:alpha/beta hydrolase [Actinomadura barringtoniae]|uniref:Alpha/beta hydrolase n=1 Tax=Actinomadura barringtoniae TaxID=1427535 RepID=A0A939T4X8_9ACTN|nr:alpha/beta hydrolase [Actinomadura barringtoniae]MBO2448824.1 alpha/beta hydrolase [Actinomadura barringtoniae]
MVAVVERPTEVVELSRGVVEYRLERRGPRVVLMMHGGHMRASLPLGEEVFAEAGFTVLAPSRPGYGRTPVGVAGFSEVVAELCERLGIGSVAAAVGQSAGGLSAVSMAARCPDLVERLILQSAVGPLAWPGRWTRLGSGVAFGPRTERLTWGLLHSLVRRWPGAGLRLLLRDLSVEPVGVVLDEVNRALVAGLFERMRSGSGFAADLRDFRDVAGYREIAAGVGQAALVIASPQDGAVPFAHGEALADVLPNARLVISRASSHFVWFGEDYPAIAETICGFLDSAG